MSLSNALSEFLGHARKVDTGGSASEARGDFARRLWRRFGGDSTGAAERCDHWGAKIYLEARDPALLSDQSELLRRLTLMRKEAVNTPWTTAYDQPHPRYGERLLSVLTWGEYGDYLIIQNRDPRISNPDPSQPPQTVAIHLCWHTGYESARTLIDFPKDHPRSTALQFPFASAVQAVTALIFDDWREALRALRLRFVLRRSCSPAVANAPRGGRRWRNLEEGTLPPDWAVRLLLRRPDFVAASRARRWETPEEDKLLAPNGKNWWCGVVADCDLPNLGFAKLGGPEGRTWGSARSLLPRQLNHVLVLETPLGQGRWFAVRKETDRAAKNARDRFRQLLPLPRRSTPADGDRSFTAPRIAAMDLILDQVAFMTSE